MNICNLQYKKLVTFIAVALSSSLIIACSSSDTPGVSDNTASISGTVPGTKIEAFADNGT